jgi:hypothetical protein
MRVRPPLFDQVDEISGVLRRLIPAPADATLRGIPPVLPPAIAAPASRRGDF